MSTELAVLSRMIEKASSYIDVFGPDETKIAGNYRKMAKILHPDGKNALDSQIASEAFVRLQDLHEEAKKAIARGTYGQLPRVTIATKKFTHQLQGEPWQGDIAQLQRATTSNEETLLKLARTTRNNDLLEREATSLRKIHAHDDTFSPYFPKVIDSFKHESNRANVLNYLEGFYTLTQVREAYGSTLNTLDAIWMFRRMLVAIGAAHEAGVLHCAVLPDHVLIHPELHGLVLVDWCYSRDSDSKKAVAMSNRWSDLYPIEFRDEIGRGTDIHMAAATMMYLNGDNMSRPFRAFMRGCMLDRIRTRPQNAFQLLHEFDELLERIGKPYHPRRFRPFSMPN